MGRRDGEIPNVHDQAAATASPEERIVNAARWYVECQEWGLRTDCSGFELREAVGAVFPDVLNTEEAESRV